MRGEPARKRVPFVPWIAVLSVLASACKSDRPAAQRTGTAVVERGSPKKPRAAPASKVRDSVHSAGERVVAIGDVHGDLDATRRALRLAGALGEQDAWTGGRLVLVQTGDQLDRGDDERDILELFDSLKDQAIAAGGAVYALNGNHETMNVSGDMRYVTAGGFADFSDISAGHLPAPLLTQLEDGMKGRAAAFYPGGPYARRLSERDLVAIVGDSVFVHGGVLPKHVEYGLDRLNRETREWMRGDRPRPPNDVVASDGPVWTRLFSSESPDCETLARTLEMLSVNRMVVGHTVQQHGVTHACDRKVWRIDTGMARHYGGAVQVLEIRGDAVHVLTEPG